MAKAARPLAGGSWVELDALAPADVSGVVLRAAFVAGLSSEELAEMGLEAADIVDADAPPSLPGGLAAGSSLADVNGVPTRTWSTAAITKAELAAALTDAINAERDRLIDAGLTVAGKTYQTDAESRANIIAVGTRAKLAIVGGAQAGDLRWHGGAADFTWILADNTTTTLDAQAMAAVFDAGTARKTALIYAARTKKNWVQNAARTKAELLAFDVTVDWP